MGVMTSIQNEATAAVKYKQGQKYDKQTAAKSAITSNKYHFVVASFIGGKVVEYFRQGSVKKHGL